MTTPQLPHPVEVDAPGFERYAYGLLSAASVVPSADTRWEANGVIYVADGCHPSGGLWPLPCNPCQLDTDTPSSPETGAERYRIRIERDAGSTDVVMTLVSSDCPDPVAEVTLNGGAPNTLTGVGDTATQVGGAPAPGDILTVEISTGDPDDPDGPCKCSTSRTYIVPDSTVDWAVEITCPETNEPKIFVPGVEFVEGCPFMVYETVQCVAPGLSDEEERAEKRLALREQYWVERQFDSTILRPAEIVGSSTVPVGLTKGVGLLEDAIAERYGGIGVIHAARQLAAPLTRVTAVRRDGARLRTPLDNLWAFGAGYTVRPPTGGAAPPAGQAWLFATGPVVVRRSEVQTREAFDQRKDTRLAIAERSYVITADCLRVAVLVEVPEA